MSRFSLEAQEAQRVTRSLLRGLTDDLLKPEFRRAKQRLWQTTGRAPWTAGHCYVVSEALYHLWGKHNGFQPHQMEVDGVSHWFLKHEDGAVWDATASQFAPVVLDYSKARRRAFLTKTPSARTERLMRRTGVMDL